MAKQARKQGSRVSEQSIKTGKEAGFHAEKEARKQGSRVPSRAYKEAGFRAGHRNRQRRRVPSKEASIIPSIKAGK